MGHYVLGVSMDTGLHGRRFVGYRAWRGVTGEISVAHYYWPFESSTSRLRLTRRYAVDNDSSLCM